MTYIRRLLRERDGDTLRGGFRRTRILVLPRRVKDAFWPLYRRTTAWHTWRLNLHLLRVHGARAARARIARLPPGDLSPIDRALRDDQQTLLRRYRRYGPVFKSQTRSGMLVAIVGNELARRFVAIHTDDSDSRPKELGHLFPIGHLRGMRGADHRHYRRILLGALQPSLVGHCKNDVRRLVREELSRLSTNSRSASLDTPQVIAGLRAISTRMLFRLLLGVSPGSSGEARLMELYARFAAGYAPARSYDACRALTFAAIREEVSRLQEEADETSVLGRLTTAESSDETVLGNLIYMTESGRFDIYSLMRWIVKYLGASPGVVHELRSPSCDAPALSTAVVLETLRLNQSEAITRQLTRDTEFEGFFIPSGTTVRICLWEAHKNGSIFPRPFEFDPHRFLRQSVTLDQFAPFGLDMHRCVAADYVVQLASLFVEELSHYEIEILGDGQPQLGAYHWEPSDQFALRLEPWDAAQRCAQRID